jgi:hypothetical protein
MKIILFNFKSKFVPKVMFSTTNKIAIFCQQILTFLGLISSFHHYNFHLNVSHRTFLHHSSLCSHASVHFLKFLTLLYTEDIVEIVVKYNKNIRRVEWMTSHPLQNAFSLNWLRLMAAVKLANWRIVKKKGRWTNFALKFGKNIKHTSYSWITKKNILIIVPL